jgi:hypothetical protein
MTISGEVRAPYLRRRAVPFATLCITALVAFACRDITRPPAAAKSSQSAARSSVVISADSLHGWAFYDDQAGVLCSDATVCKMVDGPAGQPLGTGSAELAVTATNAGKALILVAYTGTRFDHIMNRPGFSGELVM